MSKKKTKKKVIQNPVAKFMERVTRPATHKDKKNTYKRKPKHKTEVET